MDYLGYKDYRRVLTYRCVVLSAVCQIQALSRLAPWSAPDRRAATDVNIHRQTAPSATVERPSLDLRIKAEV